MSPFAVGKPSVFVSMCTSDIHMFVVVLFVNGLQNYLKDGSVIELYHKPTMTSLCLKEGGEVTGVQMSDMGSECLCVHKCVYVCVATFCPFFSLPDLL